MVSAGPAVWVPVAPGHEMIREMVQQMVWATVREMDLSESR